jgi:hypothetical protein
MTLESAFWIICVYTFASHTFPNKIMKTAIYIKIIQWVPGAISLGIKQPGREADHSPPSSVEVKNA